MLVPFLGSQGQWTLSNLTSGTLLFAALKRQHLIGVYTTAV